jgi:aminoglycoside/choline kinase family phosphotransferase
MTDESLLPSVTQALQRYIDVDEALPYEQLKTQLTERLVYMLYYEMEKLMGILYRIDVREKDVKAAFAQSNPKLIAPLLAIAIIEREMEKARSRRDSKRN